MEAVLLDTGPFTWNATLPNYLSTPHSLFSFRHAL